MAKIISKGENITIQRDIKTPDNFPKPIAELDSLRVEVQQGGRIVCSYNEDIDLHIGSTSSTIEFKVTSAMSNLMFLGSANLVWYVVWDNPDNPNGLQEDVITELEVFTVTN